MLQALEGADLHAELVAGLQVLDREIEGLAHAAEHLGAEHDRGPLDHRPRAARRHRPASPSIAPLPTSTPSSFTIAALRWSTRTWRWTLTPGRTGFDQEECRCRRDRPPRRDHARGHDHGVGAHGVEHLDLLARQPIAVAGGLRPRRDPADVVARALLLVREGDDLRAVDHAREPRVASASLPPSARALPPIVTPR